MDHEIPTTPQNNPAETIMAALAHGMTGNRETGARLLGSFVEQGHVATVSMCASLAETCALTSRNYLPANGAFGLLVVRGDGTQVSVNDLPPGVRFAAQFSTAWANGERDTAYALFNAMVHEDTDAQAAALAEGIHALFDMAVQSVRELSGHTA
ncbi:hypothetical protein ACWCWD_06525 [Streptomyces sp. NPDC001493]